MEQSPIPSVLLCFVSMRWKRPCFAPPAVLVPKVHRVRVSRAFAGEDALGAAQVPGAVGGGGQAVQSGSSACIQKKYVLSRVKSREYIHFRQSFHQRYIRVFFESHVEC